MATPILKETRTGLNWPWRFVATVVLVTYFAVTFLGTLAVEDWRQCMAAAGSYLRAHNFPVRDYEWRKHWAEFAWALIIASPGVGGIVGFRSWGYATAWLVLLGPVIFIVGSDGYLMLGELKRGEVVTAQNGYHHCDRKFVEDWSSLWLNIVSIVMSFVFVGMLVCRRAHQRWPPFDKPA
jgi:hypothetical protein